MTKTQQTHTPLPYSISNIPGDGYIMARNGFDRVAVAIVKGFPRIKDDEWEANRKFIVRACNSHYELLAAHRAVLALLDGGQPKDIPGAIMVAQSAITKATQEAA